MKKISLATLVMLAACSTMASGATIYYGEDFSSWNWDTSVPTSISSVNGDSRYWHADSDSNIFGGVTWGTAPDFKWMYFNNTPSFNGNAYKDFRLDGTLSSVESFMNPAIQGYMKNDFGGDDDYAIFSRIQVLDESGNGYSGTIARNGSMALYQITAGITTQLSQNDASLVPDGNGKMLMLSVESGVVELGMYYTSDPSTVYSLTANDTTYTNFTTIGFGGYYGWYEHIGLDNVSMTATIVPEPSTLSVCLIGLLGWAAKRRSKQ